ncbi:MAG: hypothetical protein LUQ59_00235 [Methanothrix sp.]|nr:hypothetical protein [Methanothrix sp.]
MSRNTSQTRVRNISIPNVWLWLSVFVSVMAIITSLLGIFFQKTYSREAEAWAVQAVGQDFANLAVVALMLVCTYYLSKKSLRAYLVWLGAFIYLVYAFAIYAFFIHFNFLFLVYVLILGLSFYTLIGGLMTADPTILSQSLLHNTKSKMASALLMIIGILFGSLWLSEIVPALLSNKIPSDLVETGLWVNPIHVLDLAFVLPGMIITSALLWRKNLLGFLMAVPLLIFSATMGMGIIATFIISVKYGMQVFFPAGIIVCLIILLSIYISYLFLKEVNENSGRA